MTTAGRVVAAFVMVVGVAVIGAVAAVVALAVARQVAREELLREISPAGRADDVPGGPAS